MRRRSLGKQAADEGPGCGCCLLQVPPKPAREDFAEPFLESALPRDREDRFRPRRHCLPPVDKPELQSSSLCRGSVGVRAAPSASPRGKFLVPVLPSVLTCSPHPSDDAS